MRWRVLAMAAGTEARRTLAYRLDFWVQAAVVFAIELGLAWLVWTAVYREAGVETIGGLSQRGALLYYVVVILVAKLVRGPDLSDSGVSNDVYEGGLTRFLLYPTPYGPVKYALHVGALFPALVQLVLFGAAFPLLLDVHDATVDAGSLARGAVSVAVANLLHFLIAFCLHCVAFWAENVWSLVVGFRLIGGLLGGILLPLAAWPATWRPLVDALPFRHLFGTPVETLLGRRSTATWALDLLVALAWCAGFALLGRLVFARGRLRYTGPGI